MNERSSRKYPEFRNSTLYIILACGIIVLLTGIYLAITGQTADGKTFPSPHDGGSGGGEPVSLNGISIIVTGLAICIYPVYKLTKRP